MEENYIYKSNKTSLNLWISAALGTMTTVFFGIVGVIIMGYTYFHACRMYKTDNKEFRIIRMFSMVALVVCSLVTILTYVIMIKDGTFASLYSQGSTSS